MNLLHILTYSKDLRSFAFTQQSLMSRHMLALADAKLHMGRRETAAKGLALSKAINIIDSGLLASLDVKAGGQLGERLAALSDYMCDRLLQANLHNRPELIDEVSRLLAELRDAWAQIKPAAAATGSRTAHR